MSQQKVFILHHVSDGAHAITVHATMPKLLAFVRKIIDRWDCGWGKGTNLDLARFKWRMAMDDAALLHAIENGGIEEATNGRESFTVIEDFLDPDFNVYP